MRHAHLDSVAFVKVDCVYNKPNCFSKFGNIAHDWNNTGVKSISLQTSLTCQCIKGVNQSQTEITQDIVDVDIVRVLGVWTWTPALKMWEKKK